MKTLLKGGSVVSGSGVKRADVLMDGEKVLRVGRGLTDTADTVKDVSGWMRQTEVNADFQARGGQCSRVILLPRNTSYQARRYNARFQLDRSAAQLRQVEVTAAMAFAAWPGDLVQLTRSGWSRNGIYRVQESRVTMGEDGYETTLVLGDPDAVL